MQGTVGRQRGPHALGLCHYCQGTASVALNPWDLGKRAGHQHSISLTGTRHFPVCFARESFLMLRDPVGLQEERKMLRESRVCNSPASSLFGHAKQLRRGALLRQRLCTSRRRDGLKPAGKRRQPSRQPKRGEREEGSGPMSPARLSTPAWLPTGARHWRL